jgi:PAS domain S-box-containing protein
MMWLIIGMIALGCGVAAGCFLTKRRSRPPEPAAQKLLANANHFADALLKTGNSHIAVDRTLLQAALDIAHADVALLLDSESQSHQPPNPPTQTSNRASVTAISQRKKSPVKTPSGSDRPLDTCQQWQQASLTWRSPSKPADTPKPNGDAGPSLKETVEKALDSQETQSHEHPDPQWITEYDALSADQQPLENLPCPGLCMIPFTSIADRPAWLAVGGKQTRISKRLPALTDFVGTYWDRRGNFQQKVDQLSLYQQAFENTHHAQMVIVDDRIAQVNHGFEELTGYDRDHVLGQSYYMLLPPEDVNDMQQHLTNLLNHITFSDYFETRFVRCDQTHIHVGLSPVLVKFQSQQALLVSARDVSSRVNLEQSLLDKSTQQELIIDELMEEKNTLQSETNTHHQTVTSLKDQLNFLQNMMTGITDWIRVIDRDYTVTFLNQSMKDAMGDLVGKKCYQTVGYADRCPNCPLDAVCQTGKPRHTEITMGSHEYAVVCSPLLNSDGSVQAVVELIHEITQLRHLQESSQEKSDLLEAVNESVIELNRNLEKATRELADKNTELEKLNQELKTLDQLKDNFVSTVSHELRAPMTSIKGSVGLILQGMVGKVDPKIHQYLMVAQRNADRLINLIDDLLDLSKIESGRIELHPSECLIQEIANEAVENLSTYQTDKPVTLEVKVPHHLTAWIDHDRILQVLQNLLSNALKFTESGKVTVQARNLKEAVELEVRDTGTGIPPQQLERIFDKFTQVDSTLTRKAKGTGLGLAICHAIVEEHGGNISVESQVGKGSCFRVQLPAKTSQSKPMPATDPDHTSQVAPQPATSDIDK